MRINTEKGFSMIEILVALVILAIGLLGMATLMMNSLQTSQSAAWRSAATLAAYDLSERIRSNIDQSNPSNAPQSYAKDLIAASELGKGVDTDKPRACTGDSKAVKDCDLNVWAAFLNKSIPGAKVVVTSDPITSEGIKNNNVCIGIFWEDSSGRKSDEAAPSACGKSAEKNWSSYEVKVLQ